MVIVSPVVTKHLEILCDIRLQDLLGFGHIPTVTKVLSKAKGGFLIACPKGLKLLIMSLDLVKEALRSDGVLDHCARYPFSGVIGCFFAQKLPDQYASFFMTWDLKESLAIPEPKMVIPSHPFKLCFSGGLGDCSSEQSIQEVKSFQSANHFDKHGVEVGVVKLVQDEVTRHVGSIFRLIKKSVKEVHHEIPALGLCILLKNTFEAFKKFDRPA
ncbi:hypothetical protein HG531_001443 [Fusarium graminearum]|nr:hypothetical protein HG531_001443 [Fusarium graminearum]